MFRLRGGGGGSGSGSGADAIDRNRRRAQLLMNHSTATLCTRYDEQLVHRPDTGGRCR